MLSIRLVFNFSSELFVILLFCGLVTYGITDPVFVRREKIILFVFLSLYINVAYVIISHFN